MRVCNILFTASILVVFVLAGFAAAQEKIVPEKNMHYHQVIHLDASGNISPADVTVKAGTTVVWINHAKVPLEICFVGKQITVACKSPVHFVVDEDGSFISNRVPSGAVASLCLVEKGEFKYIARTMPKYTTSGYTRAREYDGTIIVQ